MTEMQEIRLAVWSGPRNISTAMMYSFANRSDCAVVDEPFYACYLDQTGLDHPMRDAILDAQSRVPDRVIADLTGSVPSGKRVFYQKHMAQHMIPGISRDWFGQCVHVFLIRHPQRVVASFAAKYDNPVLDDLGFRQQAGICADARAAGARTVVVDSADIRQNPAAMLIRLCDVIGIDWQPAMLSWPAGGHPDDGVWAAHWYNAVHESTGFAGPEGPLPDLAEDLGHLVNQAMPYYQTLRDQALDWRC